MSQYFQLWIQMPLYAFGDVSLLSPSYYCLGYSPIVRLVCIFVCWCEPWLLCNLQSQAVTVKIIQHHQQLHWGGCVSLICQDLPSPASSISGVVRLWQSQLLHGHVHLLHVHMCVASCLQQNSPMVAASENVLGFGPGARAGWGVLFSPGEAEIP